MKAAHEHLKTVGGKRNIRTPRVIPIPKTGGLLTLIPIFAGLSALGSLAGAVTGITRAVQAAKSSREQLYETHRHNKNIEAIAIGKSDTVKPYRRGLVVYLNSKN